MYFPHYDFYNYPIVSPQRGRTLLLLGTALDGPVNIPIPVQNPQVAKRIFGEMGTLYQGYLEAYDVSSTITIYMMRVTGEHASAEMWGMDMSQAVREKKPILKFRMISGGEKYNEVSAQIRNMPGEDGEDNYVLAFNLPESIGIDSPMYALDDYENMNMLVKRINEDTRTGANCIIASTTNPDNDVRTLIPFNDIEYFEGGVDGEDVSKNDLYLALEYTYELLVGYYVDYIVLLNARFDDVHPAAFYGKAVYGTSIYEESRDYLSLQDTENGGRLVTFHGQLINFCKKQVGFGCMTHGVIGMNLIKDPSDLEKHEYSYIIRLLETSGFKTRYGLAEFSNGEWYDSGYYVSVVSGELIHHPEQEGEYFSNMCVPYAAMLASMGIDETTTNQVIPGAEKLRYQFTTNELLELSQMGVVAPRESVRKGIVIANGVTASIPTGEMHTIANVRQVQLALSFLNEALDEFVGEPILPLIRGRALQDVIETVLNSLKDDGVLIDYRYNLEYDENKGTGALTVDLQTKFMVESITASSNLRFSS